MPNRIILIVEDDLNDEHLTLRAIRQSNLHCSVIVAHNADEAMSFLNRTDCFSDRSRPEPIAIFVDNTLPGFAGAELIAEIRKVQCLKLVPIIVLSGTSDANVVDRCHVAGANSFLEKPVEMSEYVAQVSHAANYWLNLNLLPGHPGAGLY
jgi:two-component system response regulator